jgi:sugar phosphate isomerase/epimerase
MAYSRRQFGKIALGSIPVASAILASGRRLFAATKPDSKINGVLIGVIAPYSFHNMPSDAQSILDDLVQANLSAVEMQNTTVELFAGAPLPQGRGGAGGGRGPGAGGPGGAPGGAPGGGAAGGGAPGGGMQGGGGGGARGRAPLTPEQIAAQKAAAQALTDWRTSASMDKYDQLRKTYSDAGVWIYGFKIALNLDMPDAEYDYAFNVAKTLGCNQVTMEMPTDPNLTQRVGQFATKHKIMVGYHEHTQATPTLWDQAMSQSEYNGINLDAGHYVQAGNHDVLQFVQKNHAKITSLHLKDITFPENGAVNKPWGQGDTPIKEILQLAKKEKYTFPIAIELEYTIPEGSDAEKEIIKCRQYAADALA